MIPVSVDSGSRILKENVSARFRPYDSSGWKKMRAYGATLLSVATFRIFAKKRVVTFSRVFFYGLIHFRARSYFYFRTKRNSDGSGEYFPAEPFRIVRFCVYLYTFAFCARVFFVILSYDQGTYNSVPFVTTEKWNLLRPKYLSSHHFD